LEAAFAEVDGANGIAPTQNKKQAPPKETIVTNIDPHQGKKGPAAKKP